MADLGINSRAASPFKKVDFAVAWVKMAKTRRARIDTENGHRRVANYEAALTDNCKRDAGLSNGLSTSFIRYDSTRPRVAKSWLRNSVFFQSGLWLGLSGAHGGSMAPLRKLPAGAVGAPQRTAVVAG